jgi:hypothetical protein
MKFALLFFQIHLTGMLTEKNVDINMHFSIQPIFQVSTFCVHEYSSVMEPSNCHNVLT